MKGKYLLVIVCLLASLHTMAQRRRNHSAPDDQKKEAPAVVRDTLPAQDTTRRVMDDVIPENTDMLCGTLMQLINDAANDFEKAKGKVIESIASGTRWTSTTGVPGAITSSLTHSATKWQYEGIVYQGNSKDDVKEAYEKYKGTLDNCLASKGYVVSSNKNTSPKLENYPEYKYTRGNDKSSVAAKEGKHNPRAAVNVEYTAGADIYVVTVNIWSN